MNEDTVSEYAFIISVIRFIIGEIYPLLMLLNSLSMKNPFIVINFNVNEISLFLKVTFPLMMKSLSFTMKLETLIMKLLTLIMKAYH